MQTLIAALDLPAGCRVDQRVPKKLLLKNGAQTAADKRQINDGIEERWWLATLKPTTIGVPEYRDTAREYLEIVTLRLRLRAGAKAQRLVELVHRAVPYPALLLTEQQTWIGLSVAHKRWALNEAGKTVLDGAPLAVTWQLEQTSPHWPAFQAALPLNRQPTSTLHALYQGWSDTLLTLKAAQITGELKPADGRCQAMKRQEALDEYQRMEGMIVKLRAAAAKEKQIARQVELNLEIKPLETARAAVMAKL
ncbi:MAG: DUF4391 domain-containing protein [Desulfobulbus sp.]|nr:DUF4391 domain-containing protein [Desulfobulbus sp.]